MSTKQTFGLRDTNKAIRATRPAADVGATVAMQAMLYGQAAEWGAKQRARRGMVLAAVVGLVLGLAVVALETIH